MCLQVLQECRVLDGPQRCPCQACHRCLPSGADKQLQRKDRVSAAWRPAVLLCPHNTTTGIRRDNSNAQSLPRSWFHPHWHIHECLSSLFPVFQSCTLISSTAAAGGHMRWGAIASRSAMTPRDSCHGAAAAVMIFWSSTVCHRVDPTLTWPTLEESPHATRGLSRHSSTLELLRDHEHTPATERYG